MAPDGSRRSGVSECIVGRFPNLISDMVSGDFELVVPAIAGAVYPVGKCDHTARDMHGLSAFLGDESVIKFAVIDDQLFAGERIHNLGSDVVKGRGVSDVIRADAMDTLGMGPLIVMRRSNLGVKNGLVGGIAEDRDLYDLIAAFGRKPSRFQIEIDGIHQLLKHQLPFFAV